MRTIIGLACAALLATAAGAQTGRDDQSGLERAVAGRVAGQPVRCVNLLPGARSEVIAGEGIVYRVAGRVYVNRPERGAELLNRDSILVNRQQVLTQQCRNDVVELFDNPSRIQRGFVVLGDFVPYTRGPAPRS